MDKLAHHGQMIAIISSDFVSTFLNNAVQLQLSNAILHPVRHGPQWQNKTISMMLFKS